MSLPPCSDCGRPSTFAVISPSEIRPRRKRRAGGMLAAALCAGRAVPT